MMDYNDKSKTAEFNPLKQEKITVKRNENDVYSAARRAHKVEEKSTGNGLVVLAVVLSVLLIAVIVAGIFILKPLEKEQPPAEEENIVAPLEEEEEEEEEAPEIFTKCSMIFYADSVIKKDGGYTILADLYDSNLYKFDNRKIVINEETIIREDGKRLSKDALVYLVESMAGEGIAFEGEIRESDNVAMTISFDGSFREEIPAEEEEPSGEEEPPATGEEEGEIPPVKEENEHKEGQVQ